MYRQDSAPTDIQAGDIWADTNANLTYRRNDANTDWLLVPNSTSVSQTEYDYLASVTSDIQTQIDTKAPTASPTFTGVVSVPTGVGAGKLELLNSQKASGAVANFTYTPATALNLSTTYSEIIVLIQGVTTATCIVELVINQLGGTVYSNEYVLNDTATVSGVESLGQAEWVLIPAALMDNPRIFSARAHITLDENDTNFLMHGQAIAAGEGSIIYSGDLGVSGSTITEVKVETSTSTFAINTTFMVYGVRR